eukprot:CAMPEP_0201734816 /NCGR_PEP_ID=MMETSP0593-20130828/35380_1 /ASSEMBLY_ACC=CAM_ASM_000672 /TAXON_ID=267983 /ORGANISM="Skeletonema japonicum, Strain CCMP2506" /LENGTH=371 /DNA_ID=CAMNT_0048228249 /DNA_START=110 /DNA_END=1225 /DNA_ORIENTATION=+
MTNKNTHIQAPAADVRIAQLEATNAALREALSSKNAHIAMLEERLLNMSVELASSRAREDEQNLMLRRYRYASVGQVVVSQEVVGIAPAPVEDVDSNNNNDKKMIAAVHPPPPPEKSKSSSLVPNPVRNKKHGRRRRKSGSSAVSPYPTVLVDQAASSSTSSCTNNNSTTAAAAAQPTLPIDDGVKIKRSSVAPAAVRTSLSSSSSSSVSHHRRFTFMSSSNNHHDSFNDDSTTSGGGGGVGNIIGNIFHNLDRSGNSDDLSVNFPTTIDSDNRRGSMMGQLFRLRRSDLTTDDAVEEERSCEHDEEDEVEDEQGQKEEGGEEEQPSYSSSSQRRRPNRSKLSNRHMMSTRLISSTVAFPRVEDDDCLGFE